MRGRLVKERWNRSTREYYKLKGVGFSEVGDGEGERWEREKERLDEKESGFKGELDRSSVASGMLRGTL